MDWLELEQNMALWQICLTGHMQVYLFLNCSLEWLCIISGCLKLLYMVYYYVFI